MVEAFANRIIDKIRIYRKQFGWILVLIGIAIIIAMIANVGIKAFIQNLLSISPLFFTFAVLIWLVNVFFAIYRMKTLIIEDISFLDAARIYLHSSLLNFGSFIQGGGAAARVALLKVHKIGAAKTSAGITLELVLDFGFHFLVSIIFLLLNYNFLLGVLEKFSLVYVAIPFVIILIGFIILIIFKNVDFISRYFQTIKKLLTVKRLITSLVCTLALWIANALMPYFLFKGLGYDIDYFLLLFSSSIAFIIAFFTLIPGGLGVRDSVRAYVYTFSTVSFGITSIISLTSRFISMSTILILAAILNHFSKKH